MHLRETGSTNDRARELAGSGAPHGTLVTASSQSSGRGRQGRRWSAPAGSSLLMSLLLRSPPPLPPLLPLIAAVAVCDVAGERARIKWPNDIVVVRDPSADTGVPILAKLAGILTEGRPQAGWAVLGIGLNVAVRLDQLPVELRGTAATLGFAPDAIEPTLERLLAALARRLAEPTAEILDAWRSRDALYGREIAWDSGRRDRHGHGHGHGHGDGDGDGDGDEHGHARGVDGMGRLIVALADGGRTALDAGEVHLEPVG